MKRRAPRRVLMLAFPQVQVLDVTGPLEVFGRTTRWLRDHHQPAPGYMLEIIAPQAGPLPTSSGFSLLAERALRDVRGPADTLLVAGGEGVAPLLGNRAVMRFLRTAATRVRRLASVCTGAFLLAEAGLLDGRRATTHWAWCAQLARRHPKVTVDPDPIFVHDRGVYTSAGVTAGMDLALALVEDDHGRQVALEVARQLVMFLRRPGGQSQFSAQLAAQIAEREPLKDLQAWIADHIDQDLSVPSLARRVAMSTRNFARVFAQQVGMPPAQFVEAARVEAARRKLEESGQRVEAVAVSCGFGSAESMRRAFLRTLHVAPRAYRERFNMEAPR